MIWSYAALFPRGVSTGPATMATRSLSICNLTQGEIDFEPKALVLPDLDAGRIPRLKYLSASVLFLQILAFVFATIFLFQQLGYIVAAGAWFSHLGRLVAALAPYLVLPFGIILSFLLHRNGSYRSAASFPFVLLAIAAAAGQIYLTIVPELWTKACPIPGLSRSAFGRGAAGLSRSLSSLYETRIPHQP